MGGVRGLVRSLSGTSAQMSELLDLLNKGIITSGESVLGHSAGLPFDGVSFFVPQACILLIPSDKGDKDAG